MAGSAADVARVATAEVGYHEGKSGGHWNNKQKYSGAVPGLEWSDYQAWCCTFTTWVFQTAGMPRGSYPVTASCAMATTWWKQQNRWSEYPAIGAQVMFGPGGGSHTGVVIAYDATTITTIEGNTNTSGSAEGDGVYRKVRQRRDAYVYGYGYPAYPGGIVSADPSWKSPTIPNPPSEEDTDMGPIDVWAYHGKLGGKPDPRDAYAYLRDTEAAVKRLEARVKELESHPLTDAQVASIAQAVATHPALAAAIANTLAARLKD
ncbi:CHAP domain-containing protein [Streptomyces sp. JH14]|uniref:CHAP domain-containing protein n=1 Tax=Streptomyces sp. JH14 TaxID=2793630 RepID=UPI0023F939F5|nr:CHAP domain-containing protein [Streptomyces sp. JH14]MDF6043263.1 CHAP domain-containing protein [Streptomyces sp. JH14]